MDSLGQGKLDQNPVLAETNAIAGLEFDGQTYKLNGKSVWQVTCSEKLLTLRSDYAAGPEAPPLTLTFNQKLNHATLLGLMKPGERQMSRPACCTCRTWGPCALPAMQATPSSTATRADS